MLLCLSTGLAAFSWSHFWVLEKDGEQAFCWIAAGSGARYATCADIRLNRFMHEYTVFEAYAKVSLKKYKPMAARNEDKNVPSGLL